MPSYFMCQPRISPREARKWPSASALAAAWNNCLSGCHGAFASVWLQFLAIIAIGALFFAGALLRFRKTLAQVF
jgi:hypothetical protein